MLSHLTATFSIGLYSTKHKTFILKCFIQFTRTNLDGFQKEEGNFNLLQKEGVPRKGGFPSEKRGTGSNPGENYAVNYTLVLFSYQSDC